MKQSYSFSSLRNLALAICLIGSISTFHAQLTGAKTIPTDYASIDLFVQDLNAQGVGSGGVTLNVPSGYLETAPVGGYLITATGTMANPIVIAGASPTKPIITASSALVAGSLNDAIFKLVGSDYVTISGLEIVENAANTITAAATNNMTEWGIALLYATVTDGANNCSIQNNTITLNRTYQNTFGIYSNSTHTLSAPATSATATGPDGGNSGLKIYGNTISNVNNGITIVGPTAAADANNGIDIGGLSLATGNTITNYGTTGTFSTFANVSGSVNGVLVRNSINYNVSYNTITSSNGGVTAGTLRAIFMPSFSTAPAATHVNKVSFNEISLRSGLVAGIMHGIYMEGSTSNVSSDVEVLNNNFTNTNHTVATPSGAVIFIYNSTPVLNYTVSNNTFTNLALSTTGSVSFINHAYSMPSGATQNFVNNRIVTAFSKGAGGTVNFTIGNSLSVSGSSSNYVNNNFSNATFSGATTIALISNTDGGTGSTKTITGNVIDNIIGGTSAFTGFNFSYWSGASVMSGNTVSNINSGGSVTGINIGSSANNATSMLIHSNTILNLNTTATGANPVIGLVCSNTSTGIQIYSNNVSGLNSAATSNVIGIQISGSNGGTLVRRNKVYNLASSNANGIVYGMAVTGGTNASIFNNLISDLRAPNSANVDAVRGLSISLTTPSSTTGVYHNTVYLNATSTGANFGTSGIFHAGSTTGTTGALELRNNIIINESVAVGTGATVAFRRSNANLANYATTSNRNLFFAGTPSASNLIFTDGTTPQQTFSGYQAAASGRDANSMTGEAAFTYGTPGSFFISLTPSSPDYLREVAGITTQVESRGVLITSPSVAVDFTGTARPAGTGINPDLGAYEFEGITPAPQIVLNSMTPGVTSQCASTPRAISATITTAGGTITGANLNYSWNGSAQTPIAMTNTSGDIWQGTLPVASPQNANVTWSITATNSIPISSTYTGAPYKDALLMAEAGPDQTINIGQSATLTANGIGAKSTVLITEVLQFKTGTGAGTYPPYVTTEDNDYIELTNVGADTINLNGYKIELYGGINGSYTIAQNILIPPSQTAFFMTGVNGTDSPADRLYKMSLGVTSSSVAMGVVLKDPFDIIADAVATNSYVFTGPSGVTSANWSGNTASGSGACGFIRTGLSDNNTAADWAVTNAGSPSTPNAQNVAFNVVASVTYSWSPGGQTTKSITVTPSPVGVYTYYVTISDGVCSPMDSVKVTVQTPVTPVANFSGTPLAITAGGIVTFTDQSTNVPTNWTWSVSPNNGISFVSSTTANSQNPVIQFNNAGNYSITLIAGNSAGSDDTTRVNYVSVGFCPTGATNAGDSDIGNVTFAGINKGDPNPTLNHPTANGTYTNNDTVPPAMVQRGGSYPLSISQITSGGTFYAAWINVFIDWNNDGSFDPVTERAFTSSGSTSSAAPTQTGTINVPTNAALSTVRMRVTLQENGNATTSPCGTYAWGEAEDYLVTVSCPTVAAPSATDVTICSGQTATLTSASAYTSNSTIVWYAAATGGSPLATANSYTTPALTATTTYYVADSLVGCPASARTAVTANVSPVTVTVNPVHVSCNGGADGSFTISNVVCGVAPFTYSVNSGAFGAIPTNLVAGSYTVVVKDVNNDQSTPYTIVVTEPSYIINVPTGSNITACQNETSAILMAAATTSQAVSTTDTIVVALNHTLSGSALVNLPFSATLPAGAVVSSATLEFTNVTTSGGNWPSDADVTVTGDVTLATAQVAPVNSTVTNAGPYTHSLSLPSGSTVNGTVTLDNTYSGTMVSNIRILVAYSYNVPAMVRWYDAATAGAILGTGNSLQTVGTTVMPNTSTPGTYTFYAEGYENTCNSASRAALTVTVKPNSTGSLTATSCGSYTGPSGAVFTSTGTYTDTVPSANGCDSIVTLNLTILPVANTTIAPVVCDSYTSPAGGVYTTSGTYSDTLAAANGCDSIITINLTVKVKTFSTISPSACGSYTTPSGLVKTVSGSYMDTIPNAAGCDSIITINLTIKNASANSITVSKCDTYTSPSGVIYTMSGTYMDTIPNAAGCDSVITIALTIKQKTASQVSVTQCGNYTSPSGKVFTMTGTYKDTIANAAGCDSIITINLTISTINVTVNNVANTLTVGEVGANYNWLDCNNFLTPISGATAQSYAPTSNGSYAVRVSKPGCVDTSVCVIVSTIGLKELSSDVFIGVMPNPTSGVITVQLRNLDKVNAKVLDAKGKVVMEMTNIQDGKQIDLTDFERGVYLIQFVSTSGTFTERVVKN